MELIGLVQAFIAVVLFGSMFIPIKCTGLDAGDGMFLHFILCTAVMLVGFVVFIVENFPPFYPYAMIGGASWASNSCVAILIIKDLGLGLTILLFSITNCSTAFLTGYFGWFGTNSRPPSSQLLSFGGLALILTGGAMVSMVKNRQGDNKSLKTSPPSSATLSDAPSMKTVSTTIEVCSTTTDGELKNVDPAKSGLRRAFFIGLALIFGVFGSFTPVPVIAMQDHPEIFVDYPTDNLPYLFSVHFGAFLQAVLLFLSYCAFKRGNPVVNPKVTLPSFACGLCFGIGNIFFLLATKNLSQAITGPIASIGPGCVASLWSVLYFREIKEGRNTWFLFAAIFITFLGSLAIGLSK